MKNFVSSILVLVAYLALTDCRTRCWLFLFGSMSFRGEVRRKVGDGVDMSAGFDSCVRELVTVKVQMWNWGL